MLRSFLILATLVTCGSLKVSNRPQQSREISPLPRRAALALPLAALPLLTNAGAALLTNSPAPALAEEQRDLQYRSGEDTKFATQPGLQGKDYGKSSMSYSDFTKTRSGLLFKDGKAGGGKTPKKGDRVVVDWTGYTIGYFGRPFEKKAGLKGGDFAGERDYSRFVVGKGEVVPALEEGVLGVREGGVRQIIFPPELGYPMVGDQRDGKMADPSHDRVGPKPTSFSGSRALDFVLTSKSDNVDKTLLLNVKVVRVDKPGGRYKF